MKRVSSVIALLCSLSVFGQHAEGQYNVPGHVFGNGAAVLTGGGYGVTGTVGQPLIGVSNCPVNSSCFGFWHLPDRIATGVTREEGKGLPIEFWLEQNYPNPFNPSTTIRYDLPNRSQVLLAVFNTLGQQVAVLASGEQEAGYHEIKFDGSGLSSGLYFYRIQAGDFVQTRTLLLLR